MKALEYLTYRCPTCHWLTPMRPDAIRQACPKCVGKETEHIPSDVHVRVAEIICGLFISFMLGYVVGRVWG